MIVLILIYLSSIQFNIQEPQNKIVFYNIDDFASLEVNGQIIFKNKSNENAPDIYEEVNLDPYFKKGINKVVIRLNNQACPDCPYNPWSLGFEIYKNGEYLSDYFKESRGKDETEGEKIVWKDDWEVK